MLLITSHILKLFKVYIAISISLVSSTVNVVRGFKLLFFLMLSHCFLSTAYHLVAGSLKQKSRQCGEGDSYHRFITSVCIFVFHAGCNIKSPSTLFLSSGKKKIWLSFEQTPTQSRSAIIVLRLPASRTFLSKGHETVWKTPSVVTLAFDSRWII